jgi:hypothetical protein
MADIYEKVLIEAPAKEVFEQVADPEKAKDMFVSVTEVERLNDKVKEPGAKYREYRQLSNRKVGTDVEITEYQPFEIYGLTSQANGMKVNYRYTFKDVEEGWTEITFEGTVIPEKFILKLTKPIVTRMLIREEKDHLIYLKKFIEGEH